MSTYGLGNVSFELSQYDEAEKNYLKTLEMAEELKSEFLMANIYNNLGAIENIRGNRLQAIAFYSKAIPLFKNISDNYGVARSYNNIGMTYADEENWIAADEFYGKSLGLSDGFGFTPLKSVTFLNRALAKCRLNNFDEANEYNYKAYRLLKQLKDELGLAEYHKVQGIINKEQKNLAESRKHFTTAIEKYLSLQNQLGIAETQLELGSLEISNKKEDEALRWFKKAKDNFQILGIKEKVKQLETRISAIEKGS
jgi:tetratricopeptide (TPR) repeat protein